MRSILFHIPNDIAGIPVFEGFGLLLWIWAVASVLLLAWLYRRQGLNADTLGYVLLLLVIGAIVWLVLPRLCDEEGFPIRGFGVMLLVAVVSAVGLATWRAVRVGVDPELILTLAFWAFVPGILGARLFYVVQKWPHEFAPIYDSGGVRALLVSSINIAQGGIVFYGSLIGGILGTAAFLYQYKLPALATLDLITPSLMLGLAIGRIGCFLNGCCYGGMCELPWAVTFPEGSPPHLSQVQRGQTFLHGLKFSGDPEGPPVITAVEPGSPAARQGLKAGQQISAINDRRVRTTREAVWVLLNADKSEKQISITIRQPPSVHRWPLEGPPARSQPVHPTQLYSATGALLLCLFLLAYDPFRRRDGELWTLMLTLYPITRFLLEIIRTDEGPIFGTGLTISQNFSLIALAAAIGFWCFILKKPPGKAFPAYQAQKAAGQPRSIS